jgi:serine/threonine protein kinase/tetratricopeptide (TPR) repeat protein
MTAPTALQSALADRYAIERELGSGGMATVYLAEDLKHRRKVAIKVLKPELAAALGSERFLREIEVTAGLTHPHILALHDSGEAAGFLYYVMPYVAGESLRARLARETQLPVGEVLRITQQVAAALEFAHKQGVIHRDIKPENILLHEGVATVADFGIALAVSAAGGERLTETGISVGTPEYMSPEQALGEGELDARSDIYSLGCVLYEMLVGEPPYTGPTAMAVLAKRLSDPVPRARRLRGAIPVPVDAALLRALAKERVDRFGSAREFAAALVAEASEGVEAVKSIVVVPFANLSPDPENEYFADGMTEEVIAALSKIHALRVISRTSAMRLKGTEKDLKTIAAELDVQYVLEGSVRRAGDSVRITAQLIDAARDAHLWADNYGGTLEDVFDMQERVSREIFSALEVRLTPDEQRQLDAPQAIGDARAYDCYLRARYALWNLTEENLRNALRDLEIGLRIVGDNALLYAGMGSVYWQLYHNDFDATEATLARVRECADRVFELEPNSPHGHRLLAFLDLHEGDTPGAVAHLERCLESDQNDTEALLWAAYISAVHLGRPSRAQPLGERLVAVDPLTPLNHGIIAWVPWAQGRFDLALERMADFVRLEPDSRFARWFYGKLLAWNGRYAEACSQLGALHEEDAEDYFAQTGFLFKCALEGNKDEGLQALSPEMKEFLWNDFHLPWFVADSYSLLDERPEALRWLERAVDKGNRNYPLLAQLDPFLENIRPEPRFQQLMERVRAEWEQVED